MSVQSPTDQQVADLLQWLRTTAESSAEFVKEQAPDVARDIIAWGVWGNAATAGVWFIFAIVSGYMLKRAMSHWRSDEFDFDDGMSVGSIFAGVFSAIGTLVSLGAVASFLLPAIKASVAPRLYLLEWITHRL